VHQLPAMEQAVALSAVDHGRDVERAAPPQLGRVIAAAALALATAPITTAGAAATTLAALA